MDRIIGNIEDKIQTEGLDQRFSNIQKLLETLKQVKEKCGSTTEKVVREIHKEIKRNKVSEAKIELWIKKLEKSFTRREIQQKLVKSEKPYMAIGFIR